MSEAKPGPEKKGKPGKDPFLPPLDAQQTQEFFRRLEARSQEEQEAFVKRVNWNLLDATTDHRLFGWLITNLASGDVTRERFVLTVLAKLPHPRRARHAPRFQPLLDRLEPTVAKELAAVFGPVLGGPPKRPASKGPARPAPKAQEPPREASNDDLERLKHFFNKGK